MQRFSQEYILNIKAQIDKAQKPLDKIQSVLQVLSKEQLIKLSATKDINELNREMEKVLRSIGLTKEQTSLLTNKFSLAVKEFRQLASVNSTFSSSNNVSNAFDKYIRTIDRLKSVFSSLGPEAQAQFEKVTNASNLIKDAGEIVSLFNDEVSRFGKPLGSTTDLVNDLYQRFKSLFAVIRDSKNSISVGFSDPLSRGTKTIQGSIQEIVRSINSITSSNIKTVSEAFNQINSALDGPLDKIRNFSSQPILKKGQLDAVKAASNEIKILEAELRKLENKKGLNKVISSAGSGPEGSSIAQSQADINRKIAEAKKLQEDLIKSILDAGRARDSEGVEADRVLKNYIEQNRILDQQKIKLDVIRNAQRNLVAKIDTKNSNGLDTSKDLARLNNLNTAADATVSKIAKTSEVIKRQKQEISDRISQLKEFIKIVGSGDTVAAASLGKKLFGNESIERIDGISRTAREAKKQLKELAVALESAAEAEKKANKEKTNAISLNSKLASSYERSNNRLKDFGFFMEQAIERLIRYRIAVEVIQKATQLLASTFTFAKDFEVQFVNLSKVLNETSSNIKALESQAFRLGQTFGRSIKEITDIMFIWAQQGATQNDIIKLTQSTLIGMAAANLTATDAVETLTSAIRVYNINASDSSIIFDKLINVQRKFAVETKDLAESIKILGATAEEFGVDIDDLFGSVTAIVEVTRKTGSQVSNALKTIFAKFTEDDAVNALRQLGIAVFDIDGNLRDLDDVLSELNLRWSSLTETQRINIAKTLGGIRHYTQFIVLMEQYGIKLRAAEASQEALGFAASAAEKDLSTLSNQIERAKSIFNEFANSVGNNAFGGFITNARILLSVFENLFGPGGSFAGAVPVISKIVSGITGIGAALITIKSIDFAKAAISNKFFEPFERNILNTLSIVEGSNEKLKIALSESKRLVDGQKALSGTEFVGLMGSNLSKKQVQSLTEIARKLDVGKQAVIGFADGSTVAVRKTEEFSTTLTKSAKIITINGQKISFLKSKMIEFSLAMKTVVASVKSLAISLGGAIGTAILIETLFSLIAKAAKNQKREIDSTTDSIQNLTDQSIKLAATSNDTFKALGILGAQFTILDSQISSAKTEEERTKAVGALLVTYERLTGFLEELRTVDKNTLVDTRNLNNSDEARKKVIEKVNNAIRERVDLTLELNQKALSSAIRRKEQLETELKILTDLNKVSIEFGKTLDKNANFGSKNFQDLISTMRLGANGAKTLEEAVAGINESSAIQADFFKNLSVDARSSGKDYDEFSRKVIQAQETFKKLSKDESTKELFKKIFGDGEISFINEKDLQKEFKRVVDDLKRKGKTDAEINLKLIVSNSNILKDIVQQFEKLDSAILGNVNDINSLNEKILEFAQNSGLFLGNTSKENERFTKDVIDQVAEFKVALRNLRSDVNDERLSTARKGQPKSSAEIELDKTEELIKRAKERNAISQKEIQKLEEQKKIVEAISTADGKRRLQEALQIQEKNVELARKVVEIKAEEATTAAEISDRANRLAEVQGRIFVNEQKFQRIASSFSSNIPTDAIISTLKDILKVSSDTANIDLARRESIDQLVEGLRQEQVLREDSLKAADEAGRAQIEADLKRLEASRSRLLVEIASIDAFKKQLDIQNEQKKITVSLADSIVKKLELGHESIGSLIQIANTRLTTQASIQDLIVASALNANDTTKEGIDLIKKYTEGEITRSELATQLGSLYSRLGDSERDSLKVLLSKIELEEQSQAAKEKQLTLEAKIADVLGFSLTKINQYRKAIDETFETQKEIYNILGRQDKIAQVEVNKQKAQQNILQENLGLLKESIGILRQQDKSGDGTLYDNILLTIEKIAAAEKEVADVFNSQVRASLEKLNPLLTSASARAGELAESLTSAFSGISTAVLNRYQSISEQQKSIRQTEAEINELKRVQLEKSKELNSTNFASLKDLENARSEYENITNQIKDAEYNLSVLEGDLGRIANSNKLFKEILGNFASGLGNIFVDIQTNQLKESLTNIIRGTKFEDAFLSASEKGALKYASVLEAELTQFAATLAQLKDQSRVDLINQLRGVSGPQTQEEANRNNALLSALGVGSSGFVAPSQLVNSSQGHQRDLELVSAMDTVAKNTGMTVESLSSILAANNSTGKAINNLTSKTSDVQGVLSATANILSQSLGTAIGARAFGVQNAGAASTGASIGSGLGDAFANNDKVKKALGIFGSFLGPVGGLLGGLLGGGIGKLFGGKPERPRVKPIEDNTKALKTTTEAINALNVEFVDLRNELINAPSRFVVPSQNGFGNRGFSNVSNGVVAGSPGLIVQFNIQGGFDQSAANSAVSQINQVYATQARRNSSNSRLFR